MLDPELEMQVDELCTLSTSQGPNDEDISDLYAWIDSLEFSRPKKNITRDFSDGVLVAELIHTYLPSIVDIRNYYSALSRKNKENNWEHLCNKVLSKIGLKIEKQILQDVMDNKPGAIERVLYELRPLLAKKNRSILDYRRNLSKRVDRKGLKKVSSDTSTAQDGVNANSKQRPRSRRSSGPDGNKKLIDSIMPPSPSLMKPTLASENRSRSRNKYSADDEDLSKARVEKLLEERTKSIRSQSRPGTAQKPYSGRGNADQVPGGHDEVIASHPNPVVQQSGTIGSPATTTTTVFLTEEYILSASSRMNLRGLNFSTLGQDNTENVPTPAIRKNLFGLV